MTALGRRTMLGLLSGATAGIVSGGNRVRAEMALAASMEAGGPGIAVAGLPGGETARWAALIQPALTAQIPLRIFYLGGRDGVTGTNMFDARAVPDGQETLLFPGNATLAWLAGDRRVRFDATELVPLLTAVSSGVLCVRGGAPGRIPAGKLRIACDTTVAPTLTALMALNMLGAHPLPVTAEAGCFEAAMRGDVDAVFVRGLDLPEHLPALAANGLHPIFVVRFPNARLAAPVPPDVPDLDTALTRTVPPGDPMLAAWRAVAAASLLDAELVLPRFCPAASVARWRAACDRTAADATLTAQLPSNIRLLAGDDAIAAVEAVMAGERAQVALHRWMAERLDWRPT